jgi:co-chaperonin GroES (HSP10)
VFDHSQTPRPLGDRVLVKVLDEQEGTLHQRAGFGPLLIWGNRDETPAKKPKPARGIVVAVGTGTMMVRADGGDEPERAYMPMEVEVGDEVLFFSEVGLPCEVNGEELLLVCEQAILVVMSSLAALDDGTVPIE